MDRKLSSCFPGRHQHRSTPPCLLLAPGSWKAIPDELASSLAFTTLGNVAPCVQSLDADRRENHLPTQQGGLISQAWGSDEPRRDPGGELPLSVPASPRIRSTQRLCLPELLSKPQNVVRIDTSLTRPRLGWDGQWVKPEGGGAGLSAEQPSRDDSEMLSVQAPRTPLWENCQLPNDVMSFKVA